MTKVEYPSISPPRNQVNLWTIPVTSALALPMAYVSYKGIVPLTMIAGVLAALTMWRQRICLLASLDKWLATTITLFFVTLIAAGIMSETLVASIERGLAVAAVFLTCFCIATLARSEDVDGLRRRAWAVTVGVFISAALFFVMPMMPIEIWTVVEGGRLENEAPYALALAVMAVPICVLIWRYGAKYLAIAAGLIIFAQIWSADPDTSRIALLMALLALPLGRFAPWVIVPCFVAASVIFGGIVFYNCFAHPSLFDLLRTHYLEPYFGGDISILHRVYVYDFTNRAICSAPAFGIGVGGILHYPGYDVFLADIQRYLLPRHPHNGWLHIWSAAGVFGWLSVVALMTALFAWVGRWGGSPWMRAASTSALVAWFVIQQFSFSVWATWWLSLVALIFIITLSLGMSARDVK